MSPSIHRPVLIGGLVSVFAVAVMVNAAGADDAGQRSSDTGQPSASGDGSGETEGASKRAVGKNPFPQRVKAPSLDGGTGWLNTSGPITLKDLRGKVVLLDFWTYCCINCLHVLPDLKYLEEKYEDELVVIGVHSAKFENEKDAENIRQAILRYGIEHPVINDSNMALWRKFGVRSWPTLALIDPEGYYVGSQPGEGHRKLFDTVIERLVKYHRAKGTLDESPIRFDLERHKAEPTPLRFPGKVLADVQNDRLFIADTGHNRIVVASLDGELQDVIGTGALGRKNGGFDEAQFDHPHGLERVGNRLYVADTENHQIRIVDLEDRTVSTLAGTGRQASLRTRGGSLRQTALNSPWALKHVDGALYVCMAGPHQLWRHRLGSGTIRVYAGTGREDITDGPLRRATMAQPSGITTDTDGRFVYVCDSEGSAIRQIATNPRGNVKTLVGAHDLPQGRSLFEFGDRDGVGSQARLQHPLGIAWHDGMLYVADTYNHKIKKIVPQDGSAKAVTWLGDGQAGNRLDPPRFAEPSGLSIAGNRLLIADTNNHRICTADLDTGKVARVEISGLKPPEAPEDDSADLAGGVEATEVEPRTVASGESLRFRINFKLPEGYKLNKQAPLLYSLQAKGPQDLVAGEELDVRRRAEVEGKTATIDVPLQDSTGTGTFELALTFGYCRGGSSGLCKLESARWRVPVEVSAEATQKTVTLQAVAE